MQFVSGLPQGVYVGQTQIEHQAALPTSQTHLQGFNLALHVGDDPERVHQHRMILLNELAIHGAQQLHWLNQTHSTICHRIDQAGAFSAAEGDAFVTDQAGQVLMIMTADCLPVVLGNADGTEVANLHAGWRGLAGGVIEDTYQAMRTPARWAWLGASISQACFEVGAEVRRAFCEKYPAVESAFQAGQQSDKYYADLYAIARYILQQQGVELILGGDQCTYTQAQDYYSYRRAPKTGRMATFAFIGNR